MSSLAVRPGRIDEPFDVIVIGGGITGIGVAREAAGRGLRVALLERGDFGSGTSAATTKYIHGGIRYLEQHDIKVVRPVKKGQSLSWADVAIDTTTRAYAIRKELEALHGQPILKAA